MPEAQPDTIGALAKDIADATEDGSLLADDADFLRELFKRATKHTLNEHPATPVDDQVAKMMRAYLLWTRRSSLSLEERKNRVLGVDELLKKEHSTPPTEPPAAMAPAA